MMATVLSTIAETIHSLLDWVLDHEGCHRLDCSEGVCKT
jgi:hypothetical protein